MGKKHFTKNNLSVIQNMTKKANENSETIRNNIKWIIRDANDTSELNLYMGLISLGQNKLRLYEWIKDELILRERYDLLVAFVHELVIAKKIDTKALVKSGVFSLTEDCFAVQ